jgi:predicted nucleic acid-binding protein
MTTVVDASAWVDLLLERVPQHRRDPFAGDLAAPDLLYVEVASGLARAVRHRALSGAQAAFLLDQLRDAPIEVTPTADLVERAFELRDNLTLYDACYVALAEQLSCGVVTADARLARTQGIDVPFTLL